MTFLFDLSYETPLLFGSFQNISSNFPVLEILYLYIKRNFLPELNIVLHRARMCALHLYFIHERAFHGDPGFLETTGSAISNLL